tara:strand:+ start:1689 stop:2018 length:330 start_codon:yes stop_codon:yes gene_type:complete
MISRGHIAKDEMAIAVAPVQTGAHISRFTTSVDRMAPGRAMSTATLTMKSSKESALAITAAHSICAAFSALKRSTEALMDLTRSAFVVVCQNSNARGITPARNEADQRR